MNRVPIGLRRRVATPHARVGATPAGFAPVFPGWNVWSIWQALEPDHSIADTVLYSGVPLERQLRIWVEDLLANTPGVAVRDTFNVSHLRGDTIQFLPNTSTLSVAASRDSIPQFAGSVHLGKADASGQLVAPHVVRFFNRGQQATLPWPHDKNYLLDAVFQPSSSDPLTNAPAPDTLAGAASSASDSLISALKIVGVVAGVGLGAWLLVTVINASKS